MATRAGFLGPSRNPLDMPATGAGRPGGVGGHCRQAPPHRNAASFGARSSPRAGHLRPGTPFGGRRPRAGPLPGRPQGPSGRAARRPRRRQGRRSALCRRARPAVHAVQLPRAGRPSWPRLRLCGAAAPVRAERPGCWRNKPGPRHRRRDRAPRCAARARGLTTARRLTADPDPLTQAGAPTTTSISTGHVVIGGVGAPADPARSGPFIRACHPCWMFGGFSYCGW
jgi:hypothetical protein